MIWNKRRDERLPSRLLVIYPRRGEFVEAYAVNCAERGLFVETPFPLPEGTKAEFFAAYGDPRNGKAHRHPLKGVLRGRVVRQERRGGQPRGMAVALERKARPFWRDILLEQISFNRRYLGAPRKVSGSPAMLMHRLRRFFSLY